MLKKGISAIVLLSMAVLWPSPAHAGTPDWVRSLAQQPQKKYADDVNAVVLLDEGETTIKDNGEIISHGKIVYRILRPQGKAYAQHELRFDSETKINYFRGWSVTANGQEYEAKDKDAFERSTSTFEVYSDDKERILVLPGADVGTVVGFEYERKGRPYVFQDNWYIQGALPVEKSRFTLRLPPSWEYRAQWINHAEVQPAITGSTSVWEINDVPRIEREHNQPPARALAARILLTFFSEKIKNQTYKSWNDLGLWYGQLTTGSRDPGPAMQQKVQEIAPASMPLLERVRVLARFAQQDVRYAAIEMGIGGYRPHPATEIFAHRYGDCKDKATILGSMLAQIGIKSYYMPIHDERGIFTEKSPPDLGFNHVIIAIQLPDSSFAKPMPAIYEHPKLGHLLIFDPTNDLVPFGEIPYYEQDSYAMLVTDQGGELIHLPLSKPELNRLNRTAKLTLLPDGTLKGEVQEVHTGTEAYLARSVFSHETDADRKKLLERILGTWISAFRLDSVEAENLDNIDKDLILKYKFTAEHYAKNAGPLLLVRPRVAGEKLQALDATKPRYYAYQFEGLTLQTDSFEISLPDGYKVDELPDPAKANFSFGEYSSKTESTGNLLKYSREYRINATSVPRENIGDLNKFLHQINVDEKNMAVLKKN